MNRYMLRCLRWTLIFVFYQEYSHVGIKIEFYPTACFQHFCSKTKLSPTDLFSDSTLITRFNGSAQCEARLHMNIQG